MAESLETKVERLITPVLEQMGFEVIRIHFSDKGRRTLQIMADRKGGISLDDCANISRRVSAVLDVEDPITGEYHLEVSSPGIDRPLVKLQDFERFRGKEAKVTTSRPLEGRKRFQGVIRQVEGNSIHLQNVAEKVTYTIPFEAIASAKLVLTDALLKEEEFVHC